MILYGLSSLPSDGEDGGRRSELLAFGVGKKECPRASAFLRAVRTAACARVGMDRVGAAGRCARSGSPPAQIALFLAFRLRRKGKRESVAYVLSAVRCSLARGSRRNPFTTTEKSSVVPIFTQIDRARVFPPSLSLYRYTARTATSDASTLLCFRTCPRCSFPFSLFPASRRANEARTELAITA